MTWNSDHLKSNWQRRENKENREISGATVAKGQRQLAYPSPLSCSKP